MDGVIASLSVELGNTVAKDGAVAAIYPKNAVRVEANVTEADLKELSVGQKVKVELDWNQDQGVSYEGTVEMISYLGTVGEESTTFPVYISFVPDENTRYSMTALITTLEDGEKDDAEAEAPAEEGEKAEATEETEIPENAGRRERPADGERRERPEGAEKPENP